MRRAEATASGRAGRRSWPRTAGALAAALALSGCGPYLRQPEPQPPPPTPADTTRTERSSRGNPPFYDVFGQRYYVLDSNAGYVERGVASWYGPKFHGRPTSSGEIYDMHALTAAHKTLPLPTYALVTNLHNGHSVVVRINDRGPFVKNRLIDVSYAAARELDIVGAGTGLVEVRVLSEVPEATLAEHRRSLPPELSPEVEASYALRPVAFALEPSPPGTAVEIAENDGGLPPAEPLPAHPSTLPAAREVFLQVGAFGDPFNAERLRARLAAHGFGNVVTRNDIVGERPVYRVRIGPIAGTEEFDRLVEQMRGLDIHDTHIAVE